MITNSLARLQAMPKRPAEDSKERKEPTSTARLPVELLRQARVVAAYRGIELGDYLLSKLSVSVGDDYNEIVKDKPKKGA